MGLVTDNFGANYNHTPKTFTKSIILTATPTASGIAVTDTKNFFTKNCPFKVEVVDVIGVMRETTLADFNGTGGSITVILQTSDEVDTSPSPPTTPTWDTLMSAVQCKTVDVDGRPISGPDLDQDYICIPKGGSMRATMSARVENTYSGDGSTVEMILTARFRPIDFRDMKYF